MKKNVLDLVAGDLIHYLGNQIVQPSERTLSPIPLEGTVKAVGMLPSISMAVIELIGGRCLILSPQQSVTIAPPKKVDRHMLIAVQHSAPIRTDGGKFSHISVD